MTFFYSNCFPQGFTYTCKMTSYDYRVFRSVAPLKKNSLIKANEEISVMWARSTDRDKLTVNKLTTNQQFRHSDLITDFVTK